MHHNEKEKQSDLADQISGVEKSEEEGREEEGSAGRVKRKRERHTISRTNAFHGVTRE